MQAQSVRVNRVSGEIGLLFSKKFRWVMLCPSRSMLSWHWGLFLKKFKEKLYQHSLCQRGETKERSSLLHFSLMIFYSKGKWLHTLPDAQWLLGNPGTMSRFTQGQSGRAHVCRWGTDPEKQEEGRVWQNAHNWGCVLICSLDYLVFGFCWSKHSEICLILILCWQTRLILCWQIRLQNRLH